MLCVVYVLNFLSRQLPGILAKPIQDSLHISDGQLGRIGGLYFALFYCCISIPVGWLADKTNRSRVLAVACAIWSAATMCCGGAAIGHNARRPVRVDGAATCQKTNRTGAAIFPLLF
jgi:MFS family permease